MNVAAYFRSKADNPDAELRPGLYLHVEGGMEIRIKKIDRSRSKRWQVTVESRVTTGKKPGPWSEIKLCVGDTVSYSFDYVPEAT